MPHTFNLPLLVVYLGIYKILVGRELEMIAFFLLPGFKGPYALITPRGRGRNQISSPYTILLVTIKEMIYFVSPF